MVGLRKGVDGLDIPAWLPLRGRRSTPCGDGEERRGRPAADQIVLVGQRRGLVRHGPSFRAYRPGAGQVPRDGWRSARADRGMPRRPRRSSRSPTLPRCGHPVLGIPKSFLDTVDLSTDEARPSERIAEHRTSAELCSSGRASSQCRITDSWRAGGCAGSPTRSGPRPGPCPRPASGVADRLEALTMLLVPRGRPPMEGRDHLRALVHAGAPGGRPRRGGDIGTSVGASSSGIRNRFRRWRSSSVALSAVSPVTASHSGPLMRARMRGLQQEGRTPSWLCRCRTSSTR